MDKDQFVSHLRDHDIVVDEKINALIRNTEAGSIPSFNEFGKTVLRRLNGTDKYNRVDKITVNNSRIVAPCQAGRTFGLAKVNINETT